VREFLAQYAADFATYDAPTVAAYFIYPVQAINDDRDSVSVLVMSEPEWLDVLDRLLFAYRQLGVVGARKARCETLTISQSLRSRTTNVLSLMKPYKQLELRSKRTPLANPLLPGLADGRAQHDWRVCGEHPLDRRAQGYAGVEDYLSHSSLNASRFVAALKPGRSR
jgi:hypothetical protein